MTGTKSCTCCETDCQECAERLAELPWLPNREQEKAADDWEVLRENLQEQDPDHDYGDGPDQPTFEPISETPAFRLGDRLASLNGPFNQIKSK